jgi:aspartyl-tRNA(Asn)/glutamyl-tRNA(Gln) amidotransferase subunit A
MNLYVSKSASSKANPVVVDDMILTSDMPTSAGSKMLEGFMSLFDAEVITKLKNANFSVCAKAHTGEFAIDLVGETSYYGALSDNGTLKNASAESVKSGDAIAAVNLDVNGSVRRAAAQNGLVSIKPTYGTVSRYGTIPVVCSGETVSVMAANAADCKNILDSLVGHDDKDGTSLPEEKCDLVKSAPASIRKIALLKSMKDGLSQDALGKLDSFVKAISAQGVEVCEIDDDVICKSRPAWNILMSAELCNNVSRYDGVKYGYRAQNFTNIDELYTNSRTESFGELLKTAIIFGSETLSTENYMKVYDKALRTRRVIVESFNKLFEEYDAVVMPACSVMEYKEEMVKENKYISYEENFYTAPASITGLPALICDGVQLVGKAFSENTLFEIAKMYEKGDK